MAALILIGGAAVAVAAVLAAARFFPYGPCPSCQGRRGRGRWSRPTAYNRCRRCGGSGERIRPLSRIWPRWNQEAKRRKARIKEARRK